MFKVFWLGQAELQMREKGGGSIVFITSNTAYRAIPDRPAYSASKSGIMGLSRTMAWFLGSEQSRNTTGAELVVDGGNMIQLYPIMGLLTKLFMENCRKTLINVI